jgi:ABC-type nickel/cobalt efflux system permease component RcnA
MARRSFKESFTGFFIVVVPRFGLAPLAAGLAVLGLRLALGLTGFLASVVAGFLLLGTLLTLTAAGFAGFRARAGALDGDKSSPDKAGLSVSGLRGICYP